MQPPFTLSLFGPIHSTHFLITDTETKNNIRHKVSDNIELHDEKKFNVNEITNYQNYPDIEATPCSMTTLL
jgi:hypothetical protein